MNNNVLLAVAAIGGLWWFSKQSRRNPRPNRYRRNPIEKYDPDNYSAGKDNYYLGVLSNRFEDLIDIYEHMGYPYPSPKDKKEAAPKIKELLADINELKPLIRADWLKDAMRDYNSQVRYAKGQD